MADVVDLASARDDARLDALEDNLDRLEERVDLLLAELASLAPTPRPDLRLIDGDA